MEMEAGVEVETAPGSRGWCLQCIRLGVTTPALWRWGWRRERIWGWRGRVGVEMEAGTRAGEEKARGRGGEVPAMHPPSRRTVGTMGTSCIPSSRRGAINVAQSCFLRLWGGTDCPGQGGTTFHAGPCFVETCWVEERVDPTLLREGRRRVGHGKHPPPAAFAQEVHGSVPSQVAAQGAQSGRMEFCLGEVALQSQLGPRADFARPEIGHDVIAGDDRAPSLVLRALKVQPLLLYGVEGEVHDFGNEHLCAALLAGFGDVGWAESLGLHPLTVDGTANAILCTRTAAAHVVWW